MTDLNPCPSCRGPLDHPSGDGCANMTAHKERAVGDEELIARLDHWIEQQVLVLVDSDLLPIRDRIEALTEQLTAARQDAKEAEAYAEELERELNTCRMAQAVMDNTMADVEAKLAKAVEDRDHWSDVAGREGVCMTCRGPNGAPEPYGCTDCLNTGYCGEHHNTVADLEGRLAKAVEAMRRCRVWVENAANGDHPFPELAADDLRTLDAALKGESHE